VLHAFVIAQIVSVVRQIVTTRRIDYAAPLVEIQRRIETIRVSMIRATMWTFLLAPLVWTPLLIVALRGLLDVDAYQAFGASYLVANVAFGLVVIVCGLLAARRYAHQPLASPLATRLVRDLAGVNLAEA